MKNEKLSVIIPVFNSEQYISRCINSILNQSYKELEIICINDGSTDNTSLILDQFADRDSRVTVINTSNNGLVLARKKGLEYVTGNYCAYVDSDDWIEENMYEELMQIINYYNVDLITSGCIRDYNGFCVEQIDSVHEGLYSTYDSVNDIKSHLISMNSFFSMGILDTPWNKIYRTNILKRHQNRVPNGIRVNEDTTVVYPLILDCNSLYINHNCYYHYCIRPDSMMSDDGERALENAFIVTEYLKEIFSQYEHSVSNIMQQFKVLEKAMILMAAPEKALTKKAFCRINSSVKRIAIYGCGKLGIKMKDYVEKKTEYDIVAWVDKRPNNGCESIKKLTEVEFDALFIMALQAELVRDIYSELIEMDIEEKKILRMYYDLELGEIIWKAGSQTI